MASSPAHAKDLKKPQDIPGVGGTGEQSSLDRLGVDARLEGAPGSSGSAFLSTSHSAAERRRLIYECSIHPSGCPACSPGPSLSSLPLPLA